MFEQRKVALVLQLPDEGAELACDGDDGFVFIKLSCLESLIAEVEPVLCPPREGFDFGGLSFLSFAQSWTDIGWSSEVLGAFDKHPSGVGVAAFGNGALTSFGAAGVLVGDEPEVGHEFGRIGEPAQVAEFADDCHGGDFLKSLEGHESLNSGFPFPVC